MRGLFIFLFTLCGIVGEGYGEGYRAKVLERGKIRCFKDGECYENGKPLIAGLSTVVYDGERLIFGNDKPVPGEDRSGVMYIEGPFKAGKRLGLGKRKLHFFKEAAFRAGLKYESSAITPDGKYVILSTGFSTVGEISAEEFGYRLMHVHPVGKPEAVKVVHRCERDGYVGTDLREKLAKLLKTEKHPKGVPYLNVEGLAAIPGGKLLMGIRQMGTDYDDFEYVRKIIEASYCIEDGELTFKDDFRIVYEFGLEGRKGMVTDMGISSLEYDKYNDRLYILTAYELSRDGTDEDVGCYLWVLPLEDMYKGKEPKLVYRNKREPLVFAHKMEGLAVMDKEHVLVIADDDRITGRRKVRDPNCQFSRKLCEAAYTYIKLKKIL